MRTDPFRQLADVPVLDVTRMDLKDLCELLLNGNSNLSIVDNRIILEVTVTFFEQSTRFC